MALQQRPAGESRARRLVDEESQWQSESSGSPRSSTSLRSLDQDGSFYSTTSVLVGGENFGFTYSDINSLESVMVDMSAGMDLRGNDPMASYFEEEISALTDCFRKLKTRAMAIREEGDEEDDSAVADLQAIDDEEVQEEAMRLKNRVTTLLREMDEQEWCYEDGEEEKWYDDGEDGVCELREGGVSARRYSKTNVLGSVRVPAVL